MRISHQIYQVKNFSGFFMFWNFLQINSFEFLENFLFLMTWMRMNAWMYECNKHTQGSNKAHQTKVVGKLYVSLISIIHFGGFRFSPYRHPSSIDINGTWTGSDILNINQPLWWILGFTPDPGSIDINNVWTTQPRITGLLRVTSMESRLRTTQRECTRV